MRILAAYLLAVLGGKEKPDSKDIKKILDAGKIKYEDARIELLLKEVEGKDLETLIAEGQKKIGSAPAGMRPGCLFAFPGSSVNRL